MSASVVKDQLISKQLPITVRLLMDKMRVEEQWGSTDQQHLKTGHQFKGGLNE